MQEASKASSKQSSLVEEQQVVIANEAQSVAAEVAIQVADNNHTSEPESQADDIEIDIDDIDLNNLGDVKDSALGNLLRTSHAGKGPYAKHTSHT